MRTSAAVPVPLTVGGELLLPAFQLSVPLAVQPDIAEPPNPMASAAAVEPPPASAAMAAASKADLLNELLERPPRNERRRIASPARAQTRSPCSSHST